MRKEKRHPVQFRETLWELLVKAAAKESYIKGEHITPAAYIRQVLGRHLNRIKQGE